MQIAEEEKSERNNDIKDVDNFMVVDKQYSLNPFNKHFLIS